MDLLSYIGNTPLIELKRLNHRYPQVRILCKFEGANPGGSVKDRTALYMIKEAETSGLLDKSKIIIEPTSGNTGIALAMIGAGKGYRVKLCIPMCVSVERRHILEAFGAEIVLTPPEKGTDGAIIEARRIVRENPSLYFMPDQFTSQANIAAHYETTGPEIYSQTNGEVDIFIAGMGTTGTLMGVSKFLKEKDKSIRIIGVEPVMGHSIPGLKNMKEAIVPAIYEPARLDDKIMIDDDTAFDVARKLASVEGIFAGMSSGASVAGALKIADSIDHGTIVALLPDRGDRYLSTALFRSTCSKCPP